MTPREFYRERHPDEFSDTRHEEVLDFDREVIDHALISITGKGQDHAFESFCSRVCGRRICHNIIPNTGQAAGGDGKVDADTFPVADSLSITFYEGVIRVASHERWAFAFSAERTWRSKLQRDVKSIISTNRPYKKIFFVTNQAIPSRYRQKAQDDLTREHCIPVEILDRTWLLDQIVYENCAQFAVEELGLTSARKITLLPGIRDQQKRRRLETLNTQLAEDVQEPKFLTVENTLLAAKLARSLEEPQATVEMLFQSAKEYARTFGTNSQQVEVEYQLAWTQFWWYEDFNRFLSTYEAFIRSLGPTPSFDGLSKWRNLWQISRVAIHAINGDSKLRKTKQLFAAVERSVSKSPTGSTSRLNARFLKLELSVFRALEEGKVPGDLFAAIAEELPRAAHHLGFDFEGFIRWIEVVAEINPIDPTFESLFDLATELQASREGEISAAKMQLARAEALIDSDNAKDAVRRLCRAHAHLLKHETRSECIHCLFLLGNMYLRLGLTWAARATFVAASAIGLQYLNADDELHPGLRFSLAHLRICAVTLGLLGESLTWHELTRIMLSLTYQRTGADRTSTEEELKFEILLGRLILRIPADSREGLGSLPSVLDELDLPINADLARVKLGADPSIIDYIPKPPQGSSLDGIYHMKADMKLADVPVDVPTEPKSLSTTLFGCKFQFEFESADASLHLAEVLLTLIEPIFAGMNVGDAFAYQEQVVVRLQCGDTVGTEVQLSQLKADAHADFSLVHGRGVASALWSDPGPMSRKLLECALLIGLCSFNSEAVIKDIESKADAGLFERSYSVSRCIADLKYVVCDLESLKLSERLQKCRETFPISSVKWEPSEAAPRKKKQKKTNVKSLCSDGEFRKAMSSLSHSEITVVSPIRVAMWDAAGWFGVLYAWSPYDHSLPLMAFGFDNVEASQAIFEGWRQTYGENLADHIRISIIRGISKENPSYYRVLIGGRILATTTDDTRFIQSSSRVHKMLPTSSKNLEGFLDLYNFHRKFVFSFAGRNAVTDEDWNDVFASGVVMSDLTLREAWEIGRHDPDSAGVLEDDDVILPDNVENPPVLDLIAWKRSCKFRRG